MVANEEQMKALLGIAVAFQKSLFIYSCGCCFYLFLRMEIAMEPTVCATLVRSCAVIR